MLDLFSTPNFWGELWHSIRYSMSVIISAYLISASLSVSLGVICFMYPKIGKPTMLVADIIRPVSAIAMFPAIVSILGIGIQSRIFVIFWTAWPPVLIITINALQAADGEAIDAAMLECNRWEVLRHIQIPLSIKEITAGLRVSISAAWIGLTAAEMLGASDGLGFQILKYAQSFNFPMMYFYIVMVSVLGVTMTFVVNYFYNRMENYSY